jgi:hypothetical protein
MPARSGGMAGFIVYVVSSRRECAEKTVVFILEIALYGHFLC